MSFRFLFAIFTMLAAPTAFANTWPTDAQLCRTQKPVKLYSQADAKPEDIYYQTQKGDLVVCEGALSNLKINGTGWQRQLYIKDPAKDTLQVVPKGSASMRAYLRVDQKQTQVLNEPDASWIDREEKGREFQVLLESNDNSKVVFVRGSQIVDDFVDPFDQSDPNWIKDPSRRDKKPMLMYKVEVVDKEYLNKFLQKKMSEEEVENHVYRGWARADFFALTQPAKKEAPALPFTKRQEEKKAPPPLKAPCETCLPGPHDPIATLESIQKALKKIVNLQKEPEIIADLDQFRNLTCKKSPFGNFQNYMNAWSGQYNYLKKNGRLKSNLSKQQLQAIDALARSMYGELLLPGTCDEQDWVLWARIAANRAREERDGWRNWVKGDFRGQPIEDILPHIVGGKDDNGVQQYHVWKQNDKNQKKMGCVLNTDDWDTMVVAAARAVIEEGAAIDIMTDAPKTANVHINKSRSIPKERQEERRQERTKKPGYNIMDEALCYYSGLPGGRGACQGNELIGIQVNGSEIIPKDQRDEFQCVVAVTAQET